MDAETFISISFGAILAIFSFAVVGYAFLRDREPIAADSSVSIDSDDQALDDIFDAINTLDLEFQLDRLPKSQFQEQFQAYRLQAATVLRDQLETGRGDPAWVLEQEILLARGERENTDVRVVACPDCSAVVLANASDCPNCGTAMMSP
tara:strand:- start:593 stop:1039 length:447 start_codon:yes stop_codon:yes gene_type:complete